MKQEKTIRAISRRSRNSQNRLKHLVRSNRSHQRHRPPPQHRYGTRAQSPCRLANSVTSSSVLADCPRADSQASPEYTALTGLSHQVSESTFTGANSWLNTDQMFQNVPTANTPDSFTAASWDNARPLQMADLPQSYQLPMSGPTSFIQTASLAGLEPSVQSLSGGWDTSGFKNISDATWKAGANDAAALANFKPDTIMFNDGNLEKVVGNMRSEFGATPEFRTDSQAVFRNDDGMTFVQTDV